MGWKLPASVLMSAVISFFAWIVVQLNRPLGLATFALAFLLPVVTFRRYYSRKPRMLVPFGILVILIAILLTPPRATSLNLVSGLHLKTGCWDVEGSLWPLNESADVSQSCSYLVEPAGKVVHVSGMAWKNLEVRMPITSYPIVLRRPAEKADGAYLNAVQNARENGYAEAPGNFGPRESIIREVLMRKENHCVYIAEVRIAGGLAVVSVRGDCRAVDEFVQSRVRMF
ncbi:hypothetical protein [Thermococcus pacificus]|uniref:Uncharacterized protein n=1 Tax=Thermococcus pacificus TaxID=71998 RepID=A0A218P770_9EURY|nr:hypothetical protein [Thermococcus pacificus]ASJ06629.1 hypothetical protein A3L08_04475 [Thermococcus pacificus]